MHFLGDAQEVANCNAAVTSLAVIHRILQQNNKTSQTLAANLGHFVVKISREPPRMNALVQQRKIHLKFRFEIQSKVRVSFSGSI